MKTLYGVPYQGSKNSIAEKIINIIPSAENFYDLFAGGCAITHCAMLANRWKNFYVNDIDNVPLLFKKAIAGEFKDEKRWISRDDFYNLKDNDVYISICWSFGNNRRDYMYSQQIEPWKKALHYAKVLKDFSLLNAMGIQSDVTAKDIIKNQKEYKNKYIDWYNSNINIVEVADFDFRLQNLERLQRLQSLQLLQSLQGLQRLNITYSQTSYENVQIKPNSVIYCDIPYEDTKKYISGEFNHKAFYDWACEQSEPVYISSYNISDNRFEEIWSWQKVNQYSATSNFIVTERIYRPKHQKKLYPATLFDF